MAFGDLSTKAGGQSSLSGPDSLRSIRASEAVRLSYALWGEKTAQKESHIWLEGVLGCFKVQRVDTCCGFGFQTNAEILMSGALGNHRNYYWNRKSILWEK